MFQRDRDLKQPFRALLEEPLPLSPPPSVVDAAKNLVPVDASVDPDPTLKSRRIRKRTPLQFAAAVAVLLAVSVGLDAL